MYNFASTLILACANLYLVIGKQCPFPSDDISSNILYLATKCAVPKPTEEINRVGKLGNGSP